MYSRIVTVQVNPDKTDEAIAIFQDSVIPAAKQQKGFISLMMLMDRSSGKGMSVGVWESEADLKANERRVVTFRSNLPSLAVSLPHRPCGMCMKSARARKIIEA